MERKTVEHEWIVWFGAFGMSAKRTGCERGERGKVLRYEKLRQIRNCF